MSLRNDFVVLEEPLLEFRHGQHAVDPHRGLSLFGPYDADRNPPGRVRYGVVGTADGIAAFTVFAEAMARPMAGGAADTGSHTRARHATGCGKTRSGRCSRASTRPLQRAGKRSRLPPASSPPRPSTRRCATVTTISECGASRTCFWTPSASLPERDDPPQVVVCVVPDRVWLDCRPMSRVTNGEGARPSKAEVALRRVQPDMFGDYDPEDYDLSTDFRRQLKARALTYRAPIQVVLESTLNLDPGQAGTKTPMTDRAWNLATAIYYKAGGKPWRLASARPGVCYVGLTFKLQDPGDTRARSAACAAQMFLDTGDGVVFRGESSAWYSPRRATSRWDATMPRSSSAGF